MRRLLPIILLALLLLPGPALAASLSFVPDGLALGKPALAKACLDEPAEQVSISLAGREFPLFRAPDGCYWGPVAVDLKAKAGLDVARLLADGKQRAAAKLDIKPVDYGVRRIKVDPKYMELTPEQIARWKKETAQIKQVYATFTQERLWRGGFIKPVDSKVTGKYGRRSVINGQEKSPHGGVDLRGATGTPVKAAARGRVALVLDSYFGGLLVCLDHGQGLITRYLHLSKAMVKQGQMVKEGQVIGLVGQSGRVSGPHLHFDVHLLKARVDPLAWISLSRKLGRAWGDK